MLIKYTHRLYKDRLLNHHARFNVNEQQSDHTVPHTAAISEGAETQKEQNYLLPDPFLNGPVNQWLVLDSDLLARIFVLEAKICLCT